MNINKIKEWLKNPYNLALLGILAFSFFIILKYLTVNSALWWDEATYLDGGKYWGLGHPFWQVEQARPPLFMLLIAFFFKIGLNETGVRFMVLLVPTVLVVFMTYLLGKEFYNKKVGLIASFVMSICWVLLYNTTRVHTDSLALLFTLLSVYFFWIGYVKPEKKNTLYIYLSGLFLGLGFLTRLQVLLVIPIFLLFLLITEKLNFLKSKAIWLSVLFGFITILPYMVWGKFHYGKFLPWFSQYFAGASRSVSNAPIAWDILSYIPSFTQWILFIFFIVGLITFLDLILGFDLILKNKEHKLKPDLFVVINIILVLFFFMFFTREGSEPRWLLPIAPFLFFIVAKGIMYVYDILKKYNKTVSLILVFAVLSYGAYAHLTYNKNMIDLKKDTYIMEKPAGEWLKQNTNENDVIIAGNEQAPLTYFSEREVIGFGRNETITWENIANKHPKYLVLTTYYPSQEWVFSFPQRYPDRFKLIGAFYHDPETRTQLAVIIYEVIY